MGKHSGNLIKMKAGRNWKRRWCVLEDKVLSYYKDANSTNKPLGSITVEAWGDATEEVGKYIPNNFKVQDSATKTWFFFAAGTAEEFDQWWSVLKTDVGAPVAERPTAVATGEPAAPAAAAEEPAAPAAAAEEPAAPAAAAEEAAAAAEEAAAPAAEEAAAPAPAAAEEATPAPAAAEEEAAAEATPAAEEAATEEDTHETAEVTEAREEAARAQGEVDHDDEDEEAEEAAAAEPETKDANGSDDEGDDVVMPLPEALGSDKDADAVTSIQVNLRGYLAFLAMKSWVRRWCKFDGSTLSCFLGPSADEQLGEFKVTEIAPAMNDLGQFEPYSFKVKHTDSEQWVYFAARNDSDCKKWLAALSAGATRTQVEAEKAKKKAATEGAKASAASETAAKETATSEATNTVVSENADVVGAPENVDHSAAAEDEEEDTVAEMAAPTSNKKKLKNRAKSCAVFDEPMPGSVAAADADESPAGDTSPQGEININISGYLGKMKKGRSWKRRWVTYDGDFLRYFAKEDSKKPLGVVTVETIEDASDELGPWIPNCFRVIATISGTLYYFASKSETEVNTWKSALAAGIQAKAAARLAEAEKAKVSKDSGNSAASSAAAGGAEGDADDHDLGDESMAVAGSRKSFVPATSKTSSEAGAAAAAALTSDAGVVKGWLGKKKEGRDWKRRWCVLNGTTLSWFKSDQTKEAQGQCQVTNVEANVEELGKFIRNNFKVIGKDVVNAFFFYASTPEEAAVWVSALQAAK